MQNLTRFSLLASVAACTTAPAGPTAITLTTDAPPGFIAARDDADGRWVTPSTVTPRTFTFDTTGPYRITVGCDLDFGLTTLFQIGRTLDDDTPLNVRCGSPAFAPLTTTMVQPGTATIGNHSLSSSEPDWEVDLDSSPGLHTLAAYDATRMKIVRDVDVRAGGSSIPPIDLASGFDLVRGTLFPVNAVAGEALRASVTLELGDTTVFLHDGRPDEARFVPASQLSRTERQLASVSATRDGASRFVVTEHVGSASLALPSPMTATLTARGHDISATWQTSLLGTVNVQAIAFSEGAGRVWLHELAASESYALGLSGSATLELDALPDLPPVMLFDPGAPHTRLVVVEAEVITGERQGVAFSESLNTPEAYAVPQRARLGRLLENAR